jgi:hypothetical protein
VTHCKSRVKITANSIILEIYFFYSLEGYRNITKSTWECKAGCSCDNMPDSCFNHGQDIKYSQAVSHVTVELKINVSETYSASIIRVKLNIIVQYFYRKIKELRGMKLSPRSA